MSPSIQIWQTGERTPSALLNHQHSMGKSQAARWADSSLEGMPTGLQALQQMPRFPCLQKRRAFLRVSARKAGLHRASCMHSKVKSTDKSIDVLLVRVNVVTHS